MVFYLTPVTGRLLIDREQELNQIVRELSNKKSRIGFAITGIRRVGKTSLLQEAKDRLEKRGIIVVYISIWQILPSTIDTFISSLFDSIMDAFKDELPISIRMGEFIKFGKDAAKDILQKMKVSVEVGDDITYAISYVKGDENEYSKAIEHTFLLADRLATASQSKCVLIIDEFPSISELKTGKSMVGDPIIRYIRTINERYRNTALVISGSYVHTMKNVAIYPTSPLYKQLINMELKPLGKGAIADFFSNYLKASPNAELIDYILEVSSGIPYNLQVIGRELEQINAKRIDRKTIETAIQNMIDREGDLHFKDYINEMQPTEIRIIKAMALEESSRPSEIAKKTLMSPNDVSTLMHKLTESGLILRKERGHYVFVDWLFKTWLKSIQR